MHAVPTKREQIQALLIATICALVYLGPALIPGRALVPHPPEHFEPLRTEALANGATVETIERGNLTMADKYHQSLMWDRVIESRFRAGEFPLWTRDIGGGAPFVPQMGQPYQPWNALLFVLPSAEWYGPVVFLQLVLMGWFAYRFLRRVGCRHASAVFGMVCVVLGMWTQGRVHQNVVISAALPLFLMLSCVWDLFFAERKARSIGVLAIAAGVSWSGGFAPVSLQASYLTVALAVALAVTQREARPALLAGVGIGLGAVVSLATMGPVLLASAESARQVPTAEHLAASGLDFANVLTLAWPDLLFWPNPGFVSDRPSVAALSMLTRLDPQPNYTEMTYGAGLVALLAVAALFSRGGVRLEGLRLRGALVGLFGAAGVLAFLLANAQSPMLELTAVIPGARAGDLRRFLFTVHVAVCVLAAFGCDRWLDGAKAWGSFTLGACLTAVSAGLLFVHIQSIEGLTQLYSKLLAEVYSAQAPVTPELVQSRFRPGEVEANASHLFATGLRTWLVGLCATLAIWLRRAWTVPLLIVLVAIELLHAGYGNRLAIPVERVTTPPEVLQPAIDATGSTANGVRPRLMNLAALGDVTPRDLVVANLLGTWGVEHLGAYNPLPKARMEELWLAIEPDREGKPRVVYGSGGSGVDCLRDPATVDHPMLDVFGVEWILASTPCDSPRLRDETPAGVPEPFRLYRRSGSLPRATFVDTSRRIEGGAERLRVLGDPTRDPRAEVVLESADAPQATGDGVVDADVEVISHTDEYVAVRVICREPGYLRLADPFDRGWTATRKKDEPLDVFVADHYFRAVYLEPGDHEVEFRFDGMSVRAPRWLALLGLLISLGLILWRPRRR